MDTYVQAVTPAKRKAQSGIVGLLTGECGPKWLYAVDGNCRNCLNRKSWALNSAVECHLHTLAINPAAIDSKEVRSG
jgi:hypothetical protein